MTSDLSLALKGSYFITLQSVPQNAAHRLPKKYSFAAEKAILLLAQANAIICGTR